MRFNRSLLKRTFSEGAFWLSGKYIPYASLLKQIGWTNLFLRYLLGLAFIFFWFIGLINYVIVKKTNVDSKYSSITWIDAYQGNYESFIRTLHPNTLFLFALYVQCIRALFALLTFVLLVYLLKFRQAWSLRCRRNISDKWWLIEGKMNRIIMHIAFNPFADFTYEQLKSWSLSDHKCSISLEQIMNHLFSKEEFPKIDEYGPIISTHHLSFMYHDDFSWDKWLHYIWKKYFPSIYKHHLIVSNTLTKEQEEEKVDPRVLRDVTTSISKGKFTTILGCNGSGKSAFIKTIMNLLEKYQGKIMWVGKDMKKISPKSFYRNVAYVDQSNLIHNDISVYDYVACALFPSFKFFRENYSESDWRIKSSLEKMEMLQHKDRSMRSLSGGERQRAILSRALAQNTSVIILDEPTTYLDINAQYKILNLLKKIQIEESKTIVAVLHDIKQAQQFSDDIILMDVGQVYAYGPVKDIINRRNMEKVFGIPWN